MILWLAGAVVVLLLNIGYGIRNVIDDLVSEKEGPAVIGIICLVGVNAIIAWMIYIAVSTSSDL